MPNSTLSTLITSLGMSLKPRYTIEEVSTVLGITPKQVRSQIKKGRLKALRGSRNCLTGILHSDLETYFDVANSGSSVAVQTKDSTSHELMIDGGNRNSQKNDKGHCAPPRIPFDPNKEDTQQDASCIWVAWEVLLQVVERNREWLEYESHTSKQVFEGLFPTYDLEQLPNVLILMVSFAMREARFVPSGDGRNPIWSNPQ